MKQLIVFLAFITMVVIAFSQKNSYGVSFGVGTSSFIMPKTVGSSTSYKSSDSYQFGVSYTRQLHHNLSLYTGATWLHTFVSTTVTEYLSNNTTSYSNDFNLVAIPLQLKYNCTKHFMILGGPMIDIDVNINRVIANQSGIGLGAAIGYQVALGNTFNIMLSPHVDLHNNFTFKKTNTSSTILDAGIKLAIGFK